MNFIPTSFHKAVLSMMPKQAQINAKVCVATLGYYGAIMFLIEESEGKVDESMAVTIADIGLHMLPDVEIPIIPSIQDN